MAVPDMAYANTGHRIGEAPRDRLTYLPAFCRPAYAISVPDIAYRPRRQIAQYAISVPDIAYEARRQIADLPLACLLEICTRLALAVAA
eukprot:3578262-Rhodomonas_salina.1